MTNLTTSRRIFMSGLAAGAATFGQTASAQSGPYPNRPVKVIVPWAAGGAGDAVMRLVAKAMSARLGQPVIVDNRPGATGTIGSGAVARSAPDGYTLVYGTADSHSIVPHLYKLPYDTRKDFVAVASIGSFPYALVINPSSPAQNIAEFVRLAKNPNQKLAYGSWGVGSSGQVAMEAFKSFYKIDLLHVPYSGGGAPVLQALLANQIAIAMVPVALIDQHAKSGAVRVIGMAAKQRLANYPAVPTFVEQGVPLESGAWIGLLAPAGTPADVLARLHDVVEASVAEEATAETFARVSVVPEKISQQAYQNFINSEYDRWGKYIRDGKITVEQ